MFHYFSRILATHIMNGFSIDLYRKTFQLILNNCNWQFNMKMIHLNIAITILFKTKPAPATVSSKLEMIIGQTSNRFEVGTQAPKTPVRNSEMDNDMFFSIGTFLKFTILIWTEFERQLGLEASTGQWL